MIELKEVEKLAELARIEITEAEKKNLQKDLESILGYVGELKNAPVSTGEKVEISSAGWRPRNVMREDAKAYETGQYTNDILANAPKTERGYIKVKKIL